MTRKSLKSIVESLFLEHRQVTTYLIAGGYNTVFGFLVFAGLYLLLEDQLHYLIIAGISWIIAITNSFLVYRYLVFKSTGNILIEYLKIYVVYGLSVVLNIVLLTLLVELLHLHPIIAQFFLIGATVIISYFGHSRFTFASKQDD